MPTNDEILQVLDYVRLYESTKTTHQLFYYFEKNKLLKALIYAFPFLVKGHVLAFEMLLSKSIVKQVEIEQSELSDDDLPMLSEYPSMMRNRR